jgi:hypothetical protein
MANKRGRGKPLIAGERTHQLSIKVAERHREIAYKLGKGNISAGIRLALEQASRGNNK